MKSLLEMKDEAKEKQLEVLNFISACGFDLFPKELTDKLINDMKANVLVVPGMEINSKNIDLKS
jgi:hypothetical protein